MDEAELDETSITGDRGHLELLLPTPNQSPYIRTPMRLTVVP
jgi:hypothetical protein